MIVKMIPFKHFRQSPATIGFIAVIILLFTDNCIGQQRRSKSSTSVSASSASQVVDFDCPEEFGYYPHPDDCTQYYVCVFGGALLESCTGGLMYSHELQTCDWPRNVGCGGESVASDGNGGGVVATVSSVRVTDTRTRQSTNTRTPVPVQRERPIQRESIPKHHLYTEEDLGPAEEIESDRQQRVYRGQPATLGQVARDRDGLNRHTNAIQPAPGNGREKLSVVSFGTQQQYSNDPLMPDKKTNAFTDKTKRRKRQVRFSFPVQPRIVHSNPTTLPHIAWSTPSSHFSLLPPPLTPSTPNIHYHYFPGANRFETITRLQKQNNRNTQFSKPLRFPIEESDDFVPVLGTQYRVNLPPPAPEIVITPKTFQNNTYHNSDLIHHTPQTFQEIGLDQSLNEKEPDNYAFLNFGPPFAGNPRTTQLNFSKPHNMFLGTSMINISKNTGARLNTEHTMIHNTTNKNNIKTDTSNNTFDKYDPNRIREEISHKMFNTSRKLKPELSFSSSNINEGFVSPTNNEEKYKSEESDNNDEVEETEDEKSHNDDDDDDYDSEEENDKSENSEETEDDSDNENDKSSNENQEEGEIDSNNQDNKNVSSDLKIPEFPSPPEEFFYDPSEKYLDIENPFSDPDFDFDKFLFDLIDREEEVKAEQNIAVLNTTSVMPNDDKLEKIVGNVRATNHKYYDNLDNRQTDISTERQMFKPYNKIQNISNKALQNDSSILKQNQYNTYKEDNAHKAIMQRQRSPNHTRYNTNNDRKFRNRNSTRAPTSNTKPTTEVFLTENSSYRTSFDYLPKENEQPHFKRRRHRVISNSPNSNLNTYVNNYSSENSEPTKYKNKEFTTLKSQEVLVEPSTQDNYKSTTPFTLFESAQINLLPNFTTQRKDETNTFYSIPPNHKYDTIFPTETTTSKSFTSMNFKDSVEVGKDNDPHIINSGLTTDTTTEPTMYSVYEKYSLSELPSTIGSETDDEDSEYYDEEYEYSDEYPSEKLEVLEVKPVSPPEIPKKIQEIDKIKFKKRITAEDYDEASVEDEDYEYEDEENSFGNKTESVADEGSEEYDYEDEKKESAKPHQYEVVEDIAESKHSNIMTTTEYLPYTRNITNPEHLVKHSPHTPFISENDTETTILTSTVRYRKKYHSVPTFPSLITSTHTNFIKNVSKIRPKPSQKQNTTKRPFLTTTKNKKFRGVSKFNDTITLGNKHNTRVRQYSIKNRRKNVIPSRFRINQIKKNITETVLKDRQHGEKKHIFSNETTLSSPTPSQPSDITRQTNTETKGSSLRHSANRPENLKTATEIPKASETTTHDIDTSESKERTISVNMYEYQLTNRLNLIPDGRATISPPTYVEQQSTTAQPVSRGYNTSQQQYNQQQYDPYYNLYEDDAEIYKDIDYGQYSNQQNQNQQQYRGQYKDKQREIVQQQVIQASPPQRKPTYIQPQQQQQQSYSVPDVYSQSVSAQDYNDNYNLQVDDDIQYNKQLDLDTKLNRSVPEADTKDSVEAAPSPEATNPIALALKPSSSTSRRLTLTAAFSLETPNSPVTSSKIIQTNRNSGRRRKITNSFTVLNSDDKNDKTHEELISSYINEDNAHKPRNILGLQADIKANPLSNYDTKKDESKSRLIKNSRENYSNEQIKAINNLEELVPIKTINTTPSPMNVQKSDERSKLEHSKQATIADQLKLPQAQSLPKPFRLIIGVGRSSSSNKESISTAQSDYKAQESLTFRPSASQNLNSENSNRLQTRDKYTSTEPNPTVPITSSEKVFRARVQNPLTNLVDNTNKTNNQNERLYSRHNYRIMTTTDSNLDETSKHFRIRSRNRLPEIIRNEDISLNEKSQTYDDHKFVASNGYNNVDFKSAQSIRPRIRSTTLESIVDETKYKYDEKETSTEAPIYVTPEQRFRNRNQGNDKVVNERVSLHKNDRLITSTEPTIVNAELDKVYRGQFQNTNTESTTNKHYGLNERFQSRVNNFRTPTKSNIVDENPEQFHITELSEGENTEGKESSEKVNTGVLAEVSSQDVTSFETNRRRVQNLDINNNFSDNASQKIQSQLNQYRIISSIEPSIFDSNSEDKSKNHGSQVFESIEYGNNNKKLLLADNDEVSSSSETNLFYTTTERSYRRRPLNLVEESRGTFRDTTETYLPNGDKIPKQSHSSNGRNTQANDIKNKSHLLALSNRRFSPRSTTQVSEVETSTNYRKSNYIARDRTNQNVFSDNRESNLVPTLSTIFVTNEIESNSNYQAYPSSTIMPTGNTQFEGINTKQLGDGEDSVDILVKEQPSRIESLTEFRTDNDDDNNEYKSVNNFKPRSQGRYTFRGRSQYQTTTENQLYDDYDETSFKVGPETVSTTTQRSRYRQPLIKDKAETETSVLEENTTVIKKNTLQPRVIAIEIQPILNENIQSYNNLNIPIPQTREKPNIKITNVGVTNETFVIDIPVPSKPFLQGEYFEENSGSKESEEIKSTENSLPVYENHQRQNQYSENLSIKLRNKPFVQNNAVNHPKIINKPDTKPIIRNYIRSRGPTKNNDPIEIENSEPDPNLNINTTTYENSSTKTKFIKPSLSFKSQLLRSEGDNNAHSRSPQSTPVRCSQLDSQCNEKSFVRVRPTTASPDSQSTPGLTRGNGRNRGSATYTISPNEAEPAVSVSRGTPSSVNRNRPTLKPSTSIVSKAQEFVDIYRFPPSRPEPIYPTPQVDKTAAKCRKDVCLLPDCSCGGKDSPGDLPLEETPQIVLLTFDDSVNDLNKGLYSDLFEKGRTNPNGCPIAATFYVSHEWTDYSQVQNLYATGHEIASHSVSHSFGEQFSQKKWTREIAGQREILSAYGGVRQEDIRGMRAPFLAVGGNKMFKMLYDSNFTYDSSMPVYENKPPSWPYTLDYKIFHDCMIPPCPTRSYPGVWEVPMVMWQDLNGGRCSMGDACSNPPTSDGVYKMLVKNFERHFTSNRAPFGLFYHAAWFTQPHHKEGFIAFLDTIVNMPEVWVVTNWQALQWVRDPTPISRLNNFGPFQCNYPERPRKCNNPKVCNLWHKSGVRYMRTCQPCPDIYPWTGKSGVRTSRVDNEIINE